ncbi:MAG TPA: phosphatidylglycerol lysyltransferase domain-containing protein [Desulfuromonadaceae bacterium]|jgi:hypothetical protein
MEIPVYPASRPLSMQDKPLLDKLFIQLQPKISEFTFAALYLFCHAHGYRLTQAKGSVVLLGKGYDERSYFMPPLDGNVAGALDLLFAADLEMYGADEAFAAQFLTDRNVKLDEDRDSFDYLYLREDLAILPGNRFHNKKNRLNYFKNRHTYNVGFFKMQHCQACLSLLEKWYSRAENKNSQSLKFEYEATAAALTMADTLGLEGAMISVEGEIKAFALGERLNAETAVCHFEKFDPFMEGLAQLVNREFARLLFADCRYINREQDLGEAGLRTAKLSYHPVELVKKYRVKPIK